VTYVLEVSTPDSNFAKNLLGAGSATGAITVAAGLSEEIVVVSFANLPTDAPIGDTIEVLLPSTAITSTSINHTPVSNMRMWAKCVSSTGWHLFASLGDLFEDLAMAYTAQVAAQYTMSATATWYDKPDV
jgi:hypothetical protein